MFAAIAPALIGGAFSAFGASKQQSSSAGMAQRQMDFQAEQANTARDFNERMSSTAHQRQVEDLRAAGLNPILSANSGASSPSSPSPAGAMGQAQNVAGAGVQGALNTAQQMASIKNINAQTTKTKADTNPVEYLKSIGMSSYEISNALGISKSTVDDILKLFGVTGQATTGKGLTMEDDPSILDLVDPKTLDMTKPRGDLDRRFGSAKRERKDDINRYKKRYGLQFNPYNSQR